MMIFVEGGKLDYQEKNLQSKARTNNKLKPRMALGQNRTWAKLVGGEHSHLWAIPAPLCSSKMIYSTKVDKLSTMWVEIRC